MEFPLPPFGDAPADDVVLFVDWEVGWVKVTVAVPLSASLPPVIVASRCEPFSSLDTILRRHDCVGVGVGIYIYIIDVCVWLFDDVRSLRAYRRGECEMSTALDSIRCVLGQLFHNLCPYSGRIL